MTPIFDIYFRIGKIIIVVYFEFLISNFKFDFIYFHCFLSLHFITFFLSVFLSFLLQVSTIAHLIFLTDAFLFVFVYRQTKCNTKHISFRRMHNLGVMVFLIISREINRRAWGDFASLIIFYNSVVTKLVVKFYNYIMSVYR